MKENKTIVILVVGMFFIISFINIFNSTSANDDSFPTTFCDDVSKNMDDYSIILEKTLRAVENDLWVEEVDIYLNQVVDFKIKLINDGEPGTHAIMFEYVQDFLPGNLEYIPGSASVDPYSFSDHYVDWKLDEYLEVGESFELFFSAEAVLEGCSENFASVVCCKDFNWPRDNDTADVNVLTCEPGITIDKKVWNVCGWSDYTEVNIGENVYFKVVISNPSLCYLIHFSGVVFDQLPDNLRYVNGSSTIYDNFDWPILEEVDWDNNIVYWYKPPSIYPGENLTFFYNATAVGCGLGVNNVTAHPEGFDPVDYPVGGVSNADGSYDVSDDVSVFVNCENPGVSIEKEADCNSVCMGDLVEYTYLVSNIGNCNLTNVYVFDNKISNVEYQNGDTNSNNWLDTDETWVYKAVTTLCVNTTNIGTVTAEDELGNIVTAENNEFVEVIDCYCNSDISVDKKIFFDDEWVDDLLVEGFSVDVMFKLIVENTGTCDLTNMIIEDIVGCGIENLRDFSIQPDELNDYNIKWFYNDILLPEEKIIILFNATVCFESENKVIASGVSTYDSTLVEDDDTASIKKTNNENHRPDKPADPNPDDKEKNVEINPVLSVYVDDPDYDTLTVKFYDAEDDSIIVTFDNVGSETRVSTSWTDLEYNKTYSWYVTSYDGELLSTSNTWNFKTKNEQSVNPEITIEKPIDGLFFNNKKMLTLPNIVIIFGSIEIQVNASDEDGEIEKIEFYIEGTLKNSETDKNSWMWNERIFGTHTIKVRAYDNENNIAEDKVEVLIFNFGL